MTPPLSQLPFVVARHDSAEAISVGYNKDCHAPLAMTHPSCHCEVRQYRSNLGGVQWIATHLSGARNDKNRRTRNDKRLTPDGFGFGI